MSKKFRMRDLRPRIMSTHQRVLECGESRFVGGPNDDKTYLPETIRQVSSMEQMGEHHARPLRVFTLSGDIVPPSEWCKRLPGSLVWLSFTVKRLKCSERKVLILRTDVAHVQLLREAPATEPSVLVPLPGPSHPQSATAPAPQMQVAPASPRKLRRISEWMPSNPCT